jgi:hypothetical protein
MKNMNEENKQTQTLEQTIISVIGKVLVTPYNFSLVALTFILWLYACNFGWSSNWNFDLPKTLHDYIIYWSLAGILIGMLGQRELSGQIARLGLLTLVLAIVSLLTLKQLDYINKFCSVYFLVPMTLFSFLITIKNIWLASATNQDKQTTMITNKW